MAFERFPKKGKTSKVDVRPGNDSRDMNMLSDMDSAAPPLGGGPDAYKRIGNKTYRKASLPDQGTNKTDYENQVGGIKLNGTRQPITTKAEKEAMDGSMGMGNDYY